MLNLNMPLAHLTATFILEGIAYQVETFKITFDQPSDFKGQPQHEIIGGKFMVTLSQNSDNDLYLWAKKATLRKNGQIVFQTDLGMTVYKIDFENAYCVNLTRSVTSVGGSKTALLISPEKLSLNGVEHDNFWKA